MTTFRNSLPTFLPLVDSSVDFSTYDTNRDGSLTENELHITFILSGFEGSYGSQPSTPWMWGHRWGIEDVTCDGISLWSCGYMAY
jgi:hypothetical protein